MFLDLLKFLLVFALGFAFMLGTVVLARAWMKIGTHKDSGIQEHTPPRHC